MDRGDQLSTVTRRRLLALAVSLTASAPVAFTIAGCSDGPAAELGEAIGVSFEPETTPTPVPPTPTPEPPFVLPAGEERRMLMAGTRYQTPLYVYATGTLGPIALALGGVHGNEPGGWLAAERIVARLRPSSGALLVIPHANKVANDLFERTTTEIGDLNRAYPGRPDGSPSEQIAFQIVEAIREFHVGLVVDMHESWAFYKDRPQNGTAFLGQTVATNAGSPGVDLARGAVEAVNQRILYRHEEFFFRDRFGSNQAAAPGVPEGPSPSGASAAPQGPGGASRSSLGIPQIVPGTISILVEMGQQQSLERRIALHVEIFSELLRRAGGLA